MDIFQKGSWNLGNRILLSGKMLRISGYVINENYGKMESGINSRRSDQKGVKTQIFVFQGDFLLLLIYIIAMISLNYTQKITPGYKFTKSQENIKPLIFLQTFGIMKGL